MDTYKIKVFIPGGAGTVVESVQAASDYNARRLVEARYDHRPGMIIWDSSKQSSQASSPSGKSGK